MGSTLYICYGCLVRHPHEHRCHEDSHRDETTGDYYIGKRCMCPECHPDEETLAIIRDEVASSYGDSGVAPTRGTDPDSNY